MAVSQVPTVGIEAYRRAPSMRESIIATLRAAVISGELTPDVVYSAPTLAEQFGVSATPVREAMIDLAKEGLIEVVRNKGFRITELDARELDELAELRMLIEVPTARRIAEAGIDHERLDALRPVAQAIEDAAAAHDLIAYVSADLQFHAGLLALAGNHHLVETVRSLRSKSRLYGIKTLADRDQLVDSAREHVALLDLAATGDGPGMEDLMRRHIGHVRGIWAGGTDAV
jgi:DNA-binding GntR family transcriptional regulator